MKKACSILIAVCACLWSACGYHFSGATSLPQGIQSVSFAEFSNHTLETGVEKELQWAIEREFRRHRNIRITDIGEGVVSVQLQRLDLRPFSFDRRAQVLEYEMVLALDIQLTDRGSGKVLWQANDLRVTEYYSAIPQVLVTTSPEFLQGTLDPGDLPGLTDVQFSETQRRLTITRLFAAAAREVYFRLGDNF